MPLPATVEMVPEVSTLRTLLFSEMYMFPLLSIATEEGLPIAALVAAPPSPENPLVPLPAIVMKLPDVPDSLRTRNAPASAKTRLPLLSQAMALGWARPPLKADVPSELVLQVPDATMVPAMRVTVRVLTSTLRMQQHELSLK